MDGLEGLDAGLDPLGAALDAGLPLEDPAASSLSAVLSNFGVTDNQVSDQQLFTA